MGEKTENKHCGKKHSGKYWSLNKARKNGGNSGPHFHKDSSYMKKKFQTIQKLMGGNHHVVNSSSKSNSDGINQQVGQRGSTWSNKRIFYRNLNSTTQQIAVKNSRISWQTTSKPANAGPRRQQRNCNTNEKDPYYCRLTINDVRSKKRDTIMEQGHKVQMYV